MSNSKIATQPIQLAQILDVEDFMAVKHEVVRLYSFHYPEKSFSIVEKSFHEVEKLFNGEFEGYKACNTQYHDFRHTVQVFLSTARILDGYNLKQQGMKLSEANAQKLLASALYHDIGYLQAESDNSGSGAVYTANHVTRGVDFLMNHKQIFSMGTEDAACISRFILSTDLNTDFIDIAFQSAQERICGAIMATADLLGQMADREYLERLLFLYHEFREAGIPGYATEYDIIRKTKDFYLLVMKRFTKSLMKTYRYASFHFRERYGVKRNLYMTAVNRNIVYLDKIIGDDTTNFRHKLKRGDKQLIQAL